MNLEHVSRPCVWRAAVVAGLVLLSGLALGCELYRQDEPSTVASPGAAATGERTQQDQAADFFDAFPRESYGSFEEAEAVAGYRIPRAGSAYAYPPGSRLTSLQWFPGNEVPLSHTEYDHPSSSIGIDVGPSSLWAQKDGTSGEEILMMGEPVVLGGKQGWESGTGVLFLFSYQCGSDDDEPIWCVVRTHEKIGRAAIEEFIASIR